MKPKSFLCKSCGKVHDGIPTSYGVEAPFNWDGLTDAEKHSRGKLDFDQCVIDGEQFYVKGNIEIPIIGATEKFIWTVWVSLSHENFNRATKMRDKRGREAEPPYFGWLSTRLPFYPETLNLKTSVVSKGKGIGFRIDLEPTDHPLSIEQRNGIGWSRIQEFAETVLHYE
jgi:hypothetical protein